MRIISGKLPPPARKTSGNESAAVQQLLAQGLDLYKMGNLAEAQQCLKKLLAMQPGHAEALHALGVIAAQQGKPAQAIELIDRALAARPDYALAYYNRGNALKDSGQIDAAIASYDRALAIKPGFAKAAICRRLLQKTRKRADAPAKPDAGASSVQRQPGSAKRCSKNGFKFLELRRYDEAMTSFDLAIELKPDYAEAYLGRGVVLKALKQPEAAVASYDRAIAIKPDFLQAWCNRGIALEGMGKNEAALASHDHAIAINPQYARAHCARGVLLINMGHAEAALASLDRAIAIDPEDAKAYAARGAALYKLKREDDAIASYDHAIAIKPDFIEALWNRSVALLLTGDFSNGWRDYEWRWKNENLRLRPAGIKNVAPLWLGETSLKGKTILLYAEQGLGDTLQFCRYVKPIKALGAKVILQVQSALHNLLQQLDGAATVVANGSPPQACDFQCPLLSLPLALRTTLDTVPHPARYICSDRNLISKWRGKLGRKRKPRIGLVWSGGKKHKGDPQRSIFLGDFLALLSPEFEFVSLQKEVRKADAEVLRAHPEIRHFGEALGDFKDTAALCELMDLVISVDTSVAHLAGAMGRPLWILLPWVPDWRWLLDREDSPWYPSARLFRQPHSGDWTTVIKRVRAELAAGSFRKPVPSC